MSFSTKSILASLAICVVAVSGLAINTPGECPAATVEQNFDFQKFLGRWYQYSSYSPVEPGKCDTHDYTDYKNGTFGFNEITFLPEKNQQESTAGLLYSANEAGDGKLLITYPQYGNVPRNYYVLGTDYDHFAVVWSCRSDGSKARQTAWIITRERQPTVAVIASANAVVDQSGIAKDFVLTDQSNCA
ncbi:lazarillo protein-like [Neocloeon triangulifer]|uniref:lazarillo protein-like n=1 Tax=Neocloeon triangulifer TaxID=2078957 RepID=UPI00286F8A4F|nr:lazarillo protein-like [Neocloeon triangulifer]